MKDQLLEILRERKRELNKEIKAKRVLLRWAIEIKDEALMDIHTESIVFKRGRVRQLEETIETIQKL